MIDTCAIKRDVASRSALFVVALSAARPFSPSAAGSWAFKGNTRSKKTQAAVKTEVLFVFIFLPFSHGGE